jgi:hypothetical protein
MKKRSAQINKSLKYSGELIVLLGALLVSIAVFSLLSLNHSNIYLSSPNEPSLSQPILPNVIGSTFDLTFFPNNSVLNNFNFNTPFTLISDYHSTTMIDSLGKQCPLSIVFIEYLFDSTNPDLWTLINYSLIQTPQTKSDVSTYTDYSFCKDNPCPDGTYLLESKIIFPCATGVYASKSVVYNIDNSPPFPIPPFPKKLS